MTTTLLISSAGRRVALLESFRKAGAALNIDLNIIATDMNPEQSAACQVADAFFKVPHCSDPAFVEAVMDIATRKRVGLIVPTIDTELQAYADNAARFCEAGTRVHVGTADAVAIVRNKARTMEVLAAQGLPVPRSAMLSDLKRDSDGWNWPAFLKPVSGSSSRGLCKLDGPEDLPAAEIEPMMVQDFLEGPEFTVNVFVDKNGEVRCVVPHERLQIRAGEVEKGATRRCKNLEELAHGIARAIPGLRGVFCFQVIEDRQRGPQIIEINARFGGGYPLAEQAGAPFTRWLLEELTLGVSRANNDWIENTLMLRYDQAVFGIEQCA